METQSASHSAVIGAAMVPTAASRSATAPSQAPHSGTADGPARGGSTRSSILRTVADIEKGASNNDNNQSIIELSAGELPFADVLQFQRLIDSTRSSVRTAQQRGQQTLAAPPFAVQRAGGSDAGAQLALARSSVQPADGLLLPPNGSILPPAPAPARVPASAVPLSGSAAVGPAGAGDGSPIDNADALLPQWNRLLTANGTASDADTAVRPPPQAEVRQPVEASGAYRAVSGLVLQDPRALLPSEGQTSGRESAARSRSAVPRTALGTAASGRDEVTFGLPGASQRRTGSEAIHAMTQQGIAGAESTGAASGGHDVDSRAAAAPLPSVAEPAGRPAAPVPTPAVTAGGQNTAELQASVSHQVGERLISMAMQGQHVAKVQLHPAELGALEIRVTMHDEGAVVSINAQQPQTREAIEATLPRLREIFEADGMSLLDVDVSGSDSGAADSQTAGDETLQFTGQSSAVSAAAPDNLVAAAARTPSDHLLDLYA